MSIFRENKTGRSKTNSDIHDLFSNSDGINSIFRKFSTIRNKQCKKEKFTDSDYMNSLQQKNILVNVLIVVVAVFLLTSLYKYCVRREIEKFKDEHQLKQVLAVEKDV